MEMTEKKRPRKPRGVPIPLPLGSWWHNDMLVAFGTRSDGEVAQMVSSAAAAGGGDEIWGRDEIGKLRRGEQRPTLPLIRAIATAFSVTNPVFIAGSRQEAIDMQSKQLEHEQLRARLAQQGAIETADVTARMTSLIETELGPDEVERLRGISEAKRRSRATRVARDRDRKKK